MKDPMNRVWKVASRWSETGHKESSILDIFRSHNIVFVGKLQEEFNKIREGDLIAISDGRTIVGLGLAASTPQPITCMGINFTKKENEAFDYVEEVIGCRVSITELATEDRRPCPPGAFHAIHERADELRCIYEKLHRRFIEQQEFEINAKSCTLRVNLKSNDVLWQDNLLFRVPVYQRPYSWKENEVSRFVYDLIS